MNRKYERLENETEYDYGLRLIETKVEQNPDDLDWQDIVDLLGLNCHYDSLRKAANVTQYSGYAVMKYFKERYAKANASSAYMDELNEKLNELQKERQRFFDQRREYNSIVRKSGRVEHREDRLESAAMDLNKTVGSLYGDLQVVETDKDNEAILVFCDWHYGMTTHNVWNEYSTEICKRRVRDVVERAIERLTLHRCSKLHVVVLGDLIHGAIHVSARVASEELVCDQIMQASEILAQSINELSRYVDETKVYVTYGNHARTVANKNDNIHRDNMERLVPWWLRERLKDNERVEVMQESDNEFVLIDACGHGYCASHGDLDTVRSSPRLLSSLFQKRYGRDIEGVLLADKHHRESFEELGVDAILCSALCGTDDYANSKRLYSTPGQLMLIVNRWDGIDAEYRMKCA